MKQNRSKRMLAFAIAAVMVIMTFTGCNQSGTGDDNYIQPDASFDSDYLSTGQYSDMDIVADNANYSLLFDPATTAVSVLDKKNGEIWRTVPSVQEYPSELESTVVNEILSPLGIHYYVGTTLTDAYTYTESVEKNQVSVSSIPNGIRVEYTIGEAETVELFPIVLTAEYAENELFPKMDEDDVELFKSLFPKQVYAELEDDQRKDLLASYPNFREHDIYQQLLTTPIPIKFKKRLKEAFKNAGMTIADMEEQYKLLGYDYTLAKVPSFYVPVEYTLQEDHLEATVRCDQISYDSTAYNLVSIDFLPYFGASKLRDDGYMVIPDGVGALITLDNQSSDLISLPVYADDLNVDFSDLSTLISEQCYLPIYGIKKGDSAYLTILDEGASQATIEVSTSATVSNMNRIYSSYTLKTRQTVKPAGMEGIEFTEYSTGMYKGLLTQKIYFLRGETANYAGMAEIYRDSLLPEQSGVTADTVPLLMESYGVINRTEDFLGFQVSKDNPFTTVEQLEDMLNELEKAGVEHIVARYRNWSVDELNAGVDLKGSLKSVLGSEKDLTSLINRENTDIFLNFGLMYTANPSLFSQISLKKDAAISIQNVYLKNYFNTDDDSAARYALNLSGIEKALNAAMQLSEKNKWKNLSFSDIGTDLYSDYNKKQFVARDDFKEGLTALLEKASKDRNIMIDGANSYALPYVDYAYNVPLEGSNFSAIDQEIPLLPMILHGSVIYAGKSVNLSYDSQRQFLKSVEYGALPCFTLNYGDASLLKSSHYSDLYATQFAINRETVVKMYQRYQKDLGNLQALRIVDHNQLSADVFETVYSNGSKTIVNYGTETYANDAVSVPGQDFVVIAGEEE